jgi:hypothetical protein
VEAKAAAPKAKAIVEAATMEAAAMEAAAMKAATSAAALAVAEIGRGSKDRQNNSKDYREFVCHRASPIRARLAPDSDYRLRSGHQVFLCFLNARVASHGWWKFEGGVIS